MSLLLLAAAASAVIAFSSSALVGACLSLFERKLNALTAAAQARVLFGVSFIPLLASVAIMAAALSPLFGFRVDHCSDSHLHPHLCGAQRVNSLPAVTLVCLASVFLLRLLVNCVDLLRSALMVTRTRRALSRVCVGIAEGGAKILPFPEPQAFVLGALRPCTFVTQGLLSEAHKEHLAPVLAHERAHIRRRDPLRRMLAGFALGFHLPGLAKQIEQRLARAHEMAADTAAAEELKSGERVARALVRLTLARKRAPQLALSFAGSDVEARVVRLLDPRARDDRPKLPVLLSAIALFFVLVGASAGALHHGVEIVLGLYGS